MSIAQKDKKNCSGCGACKNICASGAIEMKADPEGFLYPVVDPEKCCECECCVEVCPFTAGGAADSAVSPSVFAVRSRDKRETRHSSSAGVGYLLARAMLNEGGVVYGAGFNDAFEVVHSRADSLEEAERFSGSKYVQSNIVDIYRSIEDDLGQGLKVLFIGTACQTAGIRSYFGGPLRENLLTCDILCYGVPSPLIFKEYLELVSRRYRSRIKKVVFRSKVKGWLSAVSGQRIEFENGRTTQLKLFTRLFFDHLTLRPSCTNCVFTTRQKPSDMTIADFWNIKMFAPDMYDPEGVSMVLLHSEKGRRMFEKIAKSIHCKELDESCCTARQFSSPAEENEARDLFWSSCRVRGIRKTLLRYEVRYFIESGMRRIIRIAGR